MNTAFSVVSAHILRWVIAVYLLSGTSWAATKVESRLQSDFGEIEVVRSIDADGVVGPPSTMLLNGKVVFQADSDKPYLKLYGIFRAGHGQAVLVGQNCGGSGCRWDSLAFVLLTEKSKPQIVTSPDFYSETHWIAPKEKSGKVVVNLGYFRQKQKIAVLNSARLSVILREDPNRLLVEDVCKNLYEAVNACVKARSFQSGCPDYASADFSTGGFPGSNAEVWIVRTASHYPGFNRNGFIAACNAACSSLGLPPYEPFRSQACVMP